VQQTIARLGIEKPVGSGAPAVFEAFRARREAFAEVAGFTTLDRPAVALDGSEQPGRHIDQVSDDFFRTLGLAAIHGRAPQPGDNGVAFLGYEWWRARLDSRVDVLGRRLTVDGRAYTIVGVAPPRFDGIVTDARTDAWIVGAPAANLQMLARLAPGIRPEQGQAAAELVFRQLGEAGAAPRWTEGMHARLVPAGRGLSGLREQYERPLLAISALVIVVLLITCTNVGNLLMVRNAGRRREIAVRMALGAGRGRLLATFLVEALLLAACGGLVGALLARWGVATLLATLPVAAEPAPLAFRTDGRLLAFLAAIALVSSVLVGLLPAWRAVHDDPGAELHASRGATVRGRWLGRALVAGQVALSVLLLVGAGLFVQTLRNLQRLDVGFDPAGLLQISVDTRGAGYQKDQVGRLQALLLERLASVPGVRSVSAIRNGVMQAAGTRARVDLPGRELGQDEAWNGAEVGPGFFETMAIPVRRGRAFTSADFAHGRGAVVVTESWAARYVPGADPIGARIGNAGQHEIVGIVADTRIFDMRTDVGPTMFFMAPTEPDRFNALEVRVAPGGDTAAVAAAVQAEIRRVNPRLVVSARTMHEEIGRMVARERLIALVSAAFGGLGLLLAAIGIFGVAAAAVARRTSELGIRIALGASRAAVIREAMRETALTVLAGLSVGLLAAGLAVRLAAPWLGDLVFGLDPIDARTFAGASLGMLGVAIGACLWPVRRALAVDPLVAMRAEQN
jgi:predicted permease